MASSSSALFVNPISGNVGIGTTTPKTNLEINGFISMKVPACYIRSDAVQTIAGWSSSTKIDYNLTPLFNRFNLFNTTSKRLEPPVNGLYFIYASYSINRSTENRFQYIAITKNATTPTDTADTFSDAKRIGFGGISHHAPSAAVYPSIQASTVVELTTTDYIEIFGSGNGTTTKYNGALDNGNFLMAYLITCL